MIYVKLRKWGLDVWEIFAEFAKISCNPHKCAVQSGTIIIGNGARVKSFVGKKGRIFELGVA